MHPYVEEGLGRERLRLLYDEAERERLIRRVAVNEPRTRVRVALGERLVRLGTWLTGPGPEHGRPVTARFYEE